MMFEKTRLFIAKPLHMLERKEPPRPAGTGAAAVPREVVSDADEPTRFLAVERLLEQRGLRPSEPAPQPDPLEDTELREALRGATWIGRVRRAWRSLSIVSRLSVALLVVAALLPLTPRLFSGVHASAPAAPAVATERPTAAAAPASSASGEPATAPSPALPGGAKVSPRVAADAVAQGRCREAVALYRELHRRQPAIEAYREAARILQEQHVGCSEGE